MEIYLDQSATTRCHEDVVELMNKIYLREYGNPSSLHHKGLEAENYVKEARKTIAKTLKATEKEIIFTSGGTESDNQGIIGCADAYKRQGKHLITTKIEHAAVLATMKHMEEIGYEVSYLDVDENGLVDLEELRAAIRPDTTLVSIMYVNNEIGTLQPIEQAATIIHEINPKTIFHVDAIQAYGKYRINPKKMGIDLLSVSGHKIHGPKGSGFLYRNEKVKLRPILFGGGHQEGYRSGTENVPGIAGMALAATTMYDHMEDKVLFMRSLKQKLGEALEKIEDVEVRIMKEEISAPHILSATFYGIRSEVLLHALEEREIYVSAGSACSSNRPAISETLKNIGLNQEGLTSTVRFSICEDTTEEEIQAAIVAINEIVPVLRRFRRR